MRARGHDPECGGAHALLSFGAGEEGGWLVERD